jgi:hypothetical protein
MLVISIQRGHVNNPPFAIRRQLTYFELVFIKIKLSIWQAVEAHRVVRRRGPPHFLDNRLTDGGEVVSLMRRPPFTPRKIPGTHFY